DARAAAARVRVLHRGDPNTRDAPLRWPLRPRGRPRTRGWPALARGGRRIRGHRGAHMSKPPFVHPTAIVDDGAVIGDGAQVWHFVHVTSTARVGARSVLG